MEITLCPPYGVVKSDLAFRMLDVSAEGQGSANRPKRARHNGISRLTARMDVDDGLWWGTAHPSSGGLLPCLTRQAMMDRISAGSRMTAITDILLPQTGQQNGLSRFASQTAAAQGIDVVDHGQETRPSLPAFAGGYPMNLSGFP